MMTHPVLMLELTRALTATRMHDAERFREGRRVEGGTGPIVASRAPAQALRSTREQVVVPGDKRGSVLHSGARVHSRRPLALDRRAGKHAARRH
jgi:hypothetical protein